MLDLLFVLVMLGSFAACLAYTVGCEALIMETLVVGAVAAGLVVYLFFSLIRPERF